ncbi:hypothetical protein [Frankia sp. EI5c]|uniref:hypothetical protein n=1 Tax=Frankia sp. EI5c TaxID=683316 RepID=UPI000825559F|nr:hypothetical protein [Frankia sp. EI5c]
MTQATWGKEVPDAWEANGRAARELVGAAPYGSLVLWGGALVHGLRFAVITPAGAATASSDTASADLVYADPASAGPAPGGHASSPEPNLFGQFEVTPAARLILLAPFSVGRLLGTEDQACRFQICGPVAVSGGEWASVALAGWVAPVPGQSVAELALAFTARHPTPDLLDLGSAWMLLEVDLAEATVRTRSGCVGLDTAEVMDLLRGSDADAEHG